MPRGRKVIDIKGKRFGQLEVVEYIGTSARGTVWKAKCDCGKVIEAFADKLKKGDKKSYGCFRKERMIILNTKHGHATRANPATYQAYRNAKKRCEDPTDRFYHRYGGRGIKFLFNSIDELVAEIGYKPYRNMSLDRIDNNGHYEKGNVRWATASQQARNK